MQRYKKIKESNVEDFIEILFIFATQNIAVPTDLPTKPQSQ